MCLHKLLLGLGTNLSKDMRDMRPLGYGGRLLIPHASALADRDSDKPAPWIFKDSLLNRSRRTQDAKQLPARSMVHMETVSSTALPSTDTSLVSGAAKYFQIGGDAAAKLLEAAIVPCMNYFLLAYCLGIALSLNPETQPIQSDCRTESTSTTTPACMSST